MTLTQVKGNTWVLESWQLIPLYKLDDHRCVLLDTGMADQREDLDETLQRAGLRPAGIVCSHAHIDHMGSNAFFKEKYGALLAMSLGEAGHQFSLLAMNLGTRLLSQEDMRTSPYHSGPPVLADRIILPGETQISFCGATFGILRTPGHTCDHICVQTPDNVLYLADAMMTGRTLHHSKFPYALSMEDYLHSLASLRSVRADKYVVAHTGIYDEILPLIDMEARFLTERMLDLLDLVDPYTTPKLLASAICRAYHITPGNLRDLAYFEEASLAYLHYLRTLGHLEISIENNQLLYRRTAASRKMMAERAGMTLACGRWNAKETLPSH